jgi:hypothetical protein
MVRDEEAQPKQPEASARRPYRKPEVVDYGNVRDITQFGLGSVMDQTVGMRMA